MRKLKLFFAALALLCGGVNANAQGTWTAPAVPGSDISTTNTGNYAIYNIKADAIMGEGMNYNTEAIACRAEGNITGGLAARQKFTLTVSESTVKMVHANHTNKGVGCASTNANDIYADYASNNVWTFATSANYSNAYTLTLAGYGTLDVDDKWGGKLTIKNGKGYTDWAFIPEGSITDGSFAKWKERKAMYEVYQALVASESTTTYQTALETANAVYVNASASAEELRAATRALIIATAGGIQQATNASALFTNADIQSCGSKADWSNDNIDISGGAAENHWASTAITLTQTKNDIPNGLYTLIFRGMYRTGSGDVPYLQAVSGENDQKQNLPLMSDMASRWSVRGTDEWAGDDNSKVPNKLWRAAEGLAYEGASAKIDNFKVTGNTLTLTVKVTSTAQWVPFQGFDIIYNGSTNLALYKQVVAKKTEAEGLVESAVTPAKALLQSAISTAEGVSANSEEDDLNNALTGLNTAIAFASDCVAPYAKFTALSTAASAIGEVEYTETVSGSHSTFEGALSTQASAAATATTVDAINTAISTLTAAIKTYIAGAEPKNDGEYFDITCLMVNPNFEDGHNGWAKNIDPSVNWSNCEYYEKEFDINQTVTGLPTGSYSLSVQAFQRPGWAGDVWTAYSGGSDEASSVLYINSITSNVKNIMADAQDAPKLDKIEGKNYGDWPYDSQVGSEGNYKYVPNSQQGANLYFAAGLYDATCAAVVDDAANGSLKLGFKSTKNHVAGDWTIFDNFRLYYYGSSKMIYYKQYLPQLEAEIAENYLNNAAYAVLKDGQPQRTALATANSADANTLTTEAQFEEAITAITTARDAFAAAKTAYDNLAVGIAASTCNVGDGVFQMSSSQKSTYDAAVTAGTTMYQTGTASLTDVTAQILAISNAYVLNAPDASKRYKLTLTGKGALTFKKNSGTDGGYENPFMDANDNLAQHFTLTRVQSAVNPNTYTLSFEDLEGNTRYICAGEKAKAGLGNERIRTTTTADDALQIVIIATTTDGVFNMYNSLTDSKMGSNGGGLYTTNDVTDWTIAEASQASIAINTSSAKWGTTILPFAVATLPDGVKAYTCEAKTNDTQLTLDEASSIAANTPYIIEGSWDDTPTGWGLGAATTYTGGWLTGVYVATAAPVGSYVLQKNSEGVGFYKVAEDKQPTVGANRCYLTVSDAARAFFLLGEEANAINAIEVLTSGEAEIYNAAGARVPSLQKGMNIIRKADGQSYKVMVK